MNKAPKKKITLTPAKKSVFSGMKMSLRALFVCCFVSALCFGSFTQVASADVRKADIISGLSVEQRGFSVSDCPSITAEYAALMSKDGDVYFERNSYESCQIASITKIMTAIVTLENAPDDLKVIVSARAALIGESSANLVEGDVLSLDAALKALLVPSGNDAAVALAEAVGAGMLGLSDEEVIADASQEDLEQKAIDAFVAAMNQKAHDLDLKNTLYENPHGLDNDEFEGDLHSCAHDQVMVAKYAMSIPEIRDIVGSGNTTIEVKRDNETKKIDLETTDLLLDMYEPTLGIKTGMTDYAGSCFMAAAGKDGQEMYAVVLASKDDYQRFEDAKALFEWSFDHVMDFKLANSDVSCESDLDNETRNVDVVAEVSHRDWSDRTVKACFKDLDAKVNIFDLEGNVSQEMSFDELHGTIEAGQRVGEAQFFQNNKLIATQELVACERVEGPNVFDSIGVWWYRLTNGLNDETGSASSKILNVMPILQDYTINAA